MDSADWQAIYRALPEFLRAAETRSHPQPERSLVEQYSRKGQAGALAQLLNEVTTSGPPSS